MRSGPAAAFDRTATEAWRRLLAVLAVLAVLAELALVNRMGWN